MHPLVFLLVSSFLLGASRFSNVYLAGNQYITSFGPLRALLGAFLLAFCSIILFLVLRRPQAPDPVQLVVLLPGPELPQGEPVQDGITSHALVPIRIPLVPEFSESSDSDSIVSLETRDRNLLFSVSPVTSEPQEEETIMPRPDRTAPPLGILPEGSVAPRVSEPQLVAILSMGAETKRVWVRRESSSYDQSFLITAGSSLPQSAPGYSVSLESSGSQPSQPSRPSEPSQPSRPSIPESLSESYRPPAPPTSPPAAMSLEDVRGYWPLGRYFDFFYARLSRDERFPNPDDWTGWILGNHCVRTATNIRNLPRENCSIFDMEGADGFVFRDGSVPIQRVNASLVPDPQGLYFKAHLVIWTGLHSGQQLQGYIKDIAVLYAHRDVPLGSVTTRRCLLRSEAGTRHLTFAVSQVYHCSRFAREYRSYLSRITLEDRCSPVPEFQRLQGPVDFLCLTAFKHSRT